MSSAPKLNLKFGDNAPMPESEPAAPVAIDPQLMEKLDMAKQAIMADDKQGAIAIIDECMGQAPSEEMTEEPSGLRDQLSKAMGAQ